MQDWQQTFKLCNNVYKKKTEDDIVFFRQNTLRFRLNLYKLREECDIQPRLLSNLVGTMLYGRRFAPW
jgi:20S proteasome alpha/beta subunit